jgi:RNA polymerase sigma-70 factor (ECF subfamily)
MRDVDGMELRDIASVTGISENAVSVNLSRARQKIRDQLLKETKRVEERTWNT